jgi:hypothetical protein
VFCGVFALSNSRFRQQNCMLGGNFRDQYDQQGDSFNCLQPTWPTTITYHNYKCTSNRTKLTNSGLQIVLFFFVALLVFH